MTESEVIREIAAYIKILGYKIKRSNTGRRGGVSYGTKGSGDFTGLLPTGIYISIECKGEGGKQTVDQILFQKEVEENNGLYILAYSALDVKTGLAEWKISNKPIEDR